TASGGSGGCGSVGLGNWEERLDMAVPARREPAAGERSVRGAFAGAAGRRALAGASGFVGNRQAVLGTPRVDSAAKRRIRRRGGVGKSPNSSHHPDRFHGRKRREERSMTRKSSLILTTIMFLACLPATRAADAVQVPEQLTCYPECCRPNGVAWLAEHTE